MNIILSFYVFGDVVLSEVFESVAIPQTWVIPEIDSFQGHFVNVFFFSFPHKFFFGAYAENKWMSSGCMWKEGESKNHGSVYCSQDPTLDCSLGDKARINAQALCQEGFPVSNMREINIHIKTRKPWEGRWESLAESKLFVCCDRRVGSCDATVEVLCVQQSKREK